MRGIHSLAFPGLRQLDNYYAENPDYDLEGKPYGIISESMMLASWRGIVWEYEDINNVKYPRNIYVKHSSRRLLPFPKNNEGKDVLKAGLILFHTTVHDSSIGFKYPNNYPFFSTTPAHGLAVGLNEKKEDVIVKGYRSRMIIYVLKKDLLAIDMGGDDYNWIRDNSKGNEIFVAGYSANIHGLKNLNELRLIKKEQEDVKECLEYLYEIDLTSYVLEENKYTLYTGADNETMVRNQEFIFPLPLPLEFYATTKWKVATSALTPMVLMPYLMTYRNYHPRIPEVFILSLFAVNHLWIIGDFDPEEYDNDFDIAMLINYGGVPKLIFLSDWTDKEDVFSREKRHLRKYLTALMENF